MVFIPIIMVFTAKLMVFTVKFMDFVRFDAAASLYYDGRTEKYVGTMRSFKMMNFVFF